MSVAKQANKNRRGDTIVEVMIALAIFAFVAILTVTTMNAGLATAERSLELTVARNELNAQAEAIRFIHNAYVSELTLPQSCSSSSATELCQHFREVWKSMIRDAPVSTAADFETSNGIIKDFPPAVCSSVYGNNDPMNPTHPLFDSKAFVVNIRKLGLQSASGGAIEPDGVIIKATSGNPTPSLLVPATLGARIVYSNDTSEDADKLSYLASDHYTLARAEGIWVIPHISADPADTTVIKTYDFYIGTCWYGSGDLAPTVLDTVIHLYNPEG